MNEFIPLPVRAEIKEVKPVQLSEENEKLFADLLQIEKEAFFVDTLTEWAKTGNRAQRRKSKKLLAEHHAKLQEATKSLELCNTK